MADDKPGRARGVVVPSPLVYLGPLGLGLPLGMVIPLLASASSQVSRTSVSG